MKNRRTQILLLVIVLGILWVDQGQATVPSPVVTTNTEGVVVANFPRSTGDLFAQANARYAAERKMVQPVTVGSILRQVVIGTKDLVEAVPYFLREPEVVLLLIALLVVVGRSMYLMLRRLFHETDDHHAASHRA